MKCIKCNQDKPEGQFGKTREGGYKCWCKQCIREYRKEKNPQKYKRTKPTKYEEKLEVRKQTIQEQKDRARQQTALAIKQGRLIKPNKCSKCGKEGRVEAHHPDYFKPLAVQWLCKSCHNKVPRQYMKDINLH
jgi:hypothetical protein